MRQLLLRRRRCAARRSASAAAALVLAVVGCAGPPGLDRSWIEVRSHHFSVYTSLPESTARRLVEDLELFRETILTVTELRDTTPRIPTEIYAFASTRDFAPFQSHRWVGGFFAPGLRSNLVALSAGDSEVEARALLYHEYTHFLIHNEDRAVNPKWFDEGFAELLAAIEVKNGMVRIGSIPEHRGEWLLYEHRLPYSRVIRARDLEGWRERELAMFYAQSWLAVHYLSLTRPVEHGEPFAPRLARYIELVEQRRDEEDAFREAFGLSFAELDARMSEYTRQIPSYGLPRARFTADFATTARAVSRDEIGARLGWLAVARGDLPLAEDFFEGAVAANPANARALAGLGDVHKVAGRWEEAESCYRRSLELDARDFQNQLEYAEYFLHRAALEEEGRADRLARARGHLRDAAARAPDNPEAYWALGVSYLLSEDEPPGPGIEALERAVALLPSHAGIHLPLAQLHHRAGNRERAIELLRRVLYYSHASNPDAVKLLDELEAVEAIGQ